MKTNLDESEALTSADHKNLERVRMSQISMEGEKSRWEQFEDYWWYDNHEAFEQQASQTYLI